MRLVALLTAFLVVPTVVSAAARPPQVRAVTLPTAAVVGAGWRATVSVLPPTRATLQARGPCILRAPLAPTKVRRRYAASLRFPRAGTWSISVVVGKADDAARPGSTSTSPHDPRLLDPFSITAEPSGLADRRPAPRRPRSCASPAAP